VRLLHTRRTPQSDIPTPECEAAVAELAACSSAHFVPLLRYGLLLGEVLTTEGVSLGAAV
jgi:hypothetical protein